MSPIPPAAYQPTSPTRVPRPSNLSPTTQQPARYRPTTPFRTPPPPPPSVTTQPVSYYKPTTPFKATPPLSVSPLGRAAKFLSKIPKGGGTALAIALELIFPPPAGDNYYDRNPQNPIPLYKLHPPEPAQPIQNPVVPFTGGQSTVGYLVYVDAYRADGVRQYTATIYCRGPISGFVSIPGTGGDTFACWYLQAYTLQGTYQPANFYVYGWQNSQFPGTYCKIASITRNDGQPDTGGNPPPISPGINSPPGNSLGSPVAAAPSFAPSPAPKSPPSTTPPPFPGSPGTNPGGAPQPKRHPGPIPSPAPTPSGNPGDAPQPERYPGPFPSPSPTPAPNGDPGPAPGPGVEGPAPNPTPAPASSFRTAPAHPHRSPVPVEAKGPGVKPTLDIAPVPAPSSSPTPNIFAPIPFTPNPNTGNPEPKAPPLVTPNRSPDPEKDPNEDLGDKIRLGTGIITTILAGITALVQPAALQSAANAGTCQAFAPGGCAAPVANNAAAQYCSVKP